MAELGVVEWIGGGGDFFIFWGVVSSSCFFSLTGVLSLRLRFRSVDAVVSFREGLRGEEVWGSPDFVVI